MVKIQKIETMAARRQRPKKVISLSNEKEENYKSDTEDKTNSNQAGNNENQL